MHITLTLDITDILFRTYFDELRKNTKDEFLEGLVVIIDNKTNIKKLKAELRYFQTKKKTKNVVIFKKEEIEKFIIEGMNIKNFPVFLYKKVKFENNKYKEIESFKKYSLFLN